VSATGLNLPVAANTAYTFSYYILFQRAASTIGIGLAITGPAGPTAVSYDVQIPNGTDGTSALFSGWGTSYDDTVLGTAVQTASTTYVAHIFGVVHTGATAGNLTPRFRTEINNSNVTVKADSWGAALEVG
jgi:hypothetical protein